MFFLRTHATSLSADAIARGEFWNENYFLLVITLLLQPPVNLQFRRHDVVKTAVNAEPRCTARCGRPAQVAAAFKIAAMEDPDRVFELQLRIQKQQTASRKRLKAAKNSPNNKYFPVIVILDRNVGDWS